MTTIHSSFRIPKMDCAAEEQMVRDALERIEGIRKLDFDLSARRLGVYHDGDVKQITARLDDLRLGAKLETSEAIREAVQVIDDGDRLERRTLQILLAINGTMFLAEQIAGWLASSAGLLADSLDMLADSAVYGIALYAVGRSKALKRRAGHISGWLQLALAAGALAEVVRRFVFGSEPEPGYMVVVALVALAANVTCLALISRHREGGIHMKASWIFSTNDVIANIGVIVAGALVAWTGSRLPDLIIGAIIALVVASGAARILRLSERAQPVS